MIEFFLGMLLMGFFAALIYIVKNEKVKDLTHSLQAQKEETTLREAIAQSDYHRHGYDAGHADGVNAERKRQKMAQIHGTIADPTSSTTTEP